MIVVSFVTDVDVDYLGIPLHQLWSIGAYWGHVHYQAVKKGLVSPPVPFEDG